MQGLWGLMPLFYPSVASTLPDSCTGGLLGTQLGAKSTSSLWRTWCTVTSNDTVPEAGTLDVVLGYVDERRETALLALQVSTLLLVFSSPESLLCFYNLPSCSGTNTSGHWCGESTGRYLSILFNLIISKNCSFVEGSEGLLPLTSSMQMCCHVIWRFI